MTDAITIPAGCYPNVRELAVFDGTRPRPQTLLESERLRALVAGLEPGQQIPPHPEALAIYYVIEGEGTMVVDGETFAVGPGVLIIAPAGCARGLRASSRLVFLAVRPGV